MIDNYFPHQLFYSNCTLIIFFKKSLNDIAAGAKVLGPSPIILVGGERFFSEKILLPEDVLPKNLDSFLEISIEGLSPFPVEHLYWGYFYDKTERAVLLYAMYAERLSSEEQAALLADEVAYVFPSFIAGYGQSYDEPTVSFIKVEESMSAIFWESHSPVPSYVESLSIGDSPESARSRLLRSINTNGYSIQPGYWELEKTDLLPNKSVRFESVYHSDDESKPNHVLVLTEKNGLTWNADIRPRLLTREKHKQEKKTRILWFATLGALAAFAIFILIEILGVVGESYLTSKKAHFKSQEAKVKLIEGEESLVQKIERLGHNYYSPLKVLELLNNHRPKKVYFTSVVLGGKNDAVIEGVAQSVDDLNKYTDDLNASGLVEKFEVGQIVSRQGRITFKMDITFRVQQKAEEPAVS